MATTPPKQPHKVLEIQQDTIKPTTTKTNVGIITSVNRGIKIIQSIPRNLTHFMTKTTR